MNRPRNVLFILSDQHNAKVLGHAGHAMVHTPNLDQLAAEGVRFTACTTANPICTPSRVSFLSGQYAHNHGIYGLCGPRPTLPSVLGHFRRHGWRTAAIGKIHCPDMWVEDDSDQFQEVCQGCSISGWAGYRRHLLARGAYASWEASEGRPGVFGQCMDGYVSELAWEDTPEGWSVGQAIEVMRRCRADGRPFFIHLSFPRPHQTYAPLREFWDLYPEDRCPLPPNAEYDMVAAGKSPALIRSAHTFRTDERWIEFEPRTYEAARLRKLRGYLGNVSMVDRAVGEVLAALAAEGLADDTAVVYSSDHGDHACEHGAMEKAPGIGSDSITRIPFLWRVPGVSRAGHVVNEVVESVDVAPTLCALAGLPPLVTADGRDLSAQLAGAAGDADRSGVTEFAWSKSLRWKNWRLVRYPRELYAQEHPQGFGELYDLATDPWEMHNRWADPAYAAIRMELESRLYDWLVTTTRVVSTNCVSPPPGPQVQERFYVRTELDGKISPAHLRAHVAARGNINYL